MRRIGRCSRWSGIAICIGAGLLLILFCPLRLLLALAALALIVLGFLMLKC